MTIYTTEAEFIRSAVAFALPDPTLVASREHTLINQANGPIVVSSIGATPFSTGGVNTATITLTAGQSIRYQSDGVRWTARSGSGTRPFFAGTAVTDAAGNAVFTFPAGLFPAAPVIDTEIQFPASANPIDHRITALTATSCTINCKQSPTLIILSLSVLGIAANIPGVTVHLIATPPGATP